MGRNKARDTNEHTNNGGIDPSLTTVVADRPLQALKQQLAAAQTALAQAQAQVTQTQPVYLAARTALEKSQNKLTIGLATAAEVEISQTAFETARVAFARAEAALEDATLRVQTLPDAIREREQTVQAALRDTLRQQAMEKAAQLAAILAQAKALSDELLSIHDRAEQVFPVESLLQLEGGGLLSVMDLGEHGGFVTRAAGIPALHSPWLTNDRARQQPSLYDTWRTQVNDYLALSPAERADRDQQYRVRALEQAKQHQRDELVKQAAYERWLKQGLEPIPALQPVAPPRAEQLGKR